MQSISEPVVSWEDRLAKTEYQPDYLYTLPTLSSDSKVHTVVNSSERPFLDSITADYVARERVTQGHSLHSYRFELPHSPKSREAHTPHHLLSVETDSSTAPGFPDFIYRGIFSAEQQLTTDWPKLDLQDLDQIYIPAWRHRPKLSRLQENPVVIPGKGRHLQPMSAGSPVVISPPITRTSSKEQAENNPGASPQRVRAKVPQSKDRNNKSQDKDGAICHKASDAVSSYPDIVTQSRFTECEDKLHACALGTGRAVGDLLYAIFVAGASFVSGVSDALIHNEGHNRAMRHSLLHMYKRGQSMWKNTICARVGLDCFRQTSVKDNYNVEQGHQYIEWRCLPGWNIDGFPPPLPLNFENGQAADEILEDFVAEEKTQHHTNWVYVSRNDAFKNDSAPETAPNQCTKQPETSAPELPAKDQVASSPEASSATQ